MMTQAPTYPAEIKELLERGHAGDQSVLPQIKEAFQRYPALAAGIGDLPKHAEAAVLDLICGASVTAKEAVGVTLNHMRQSLAAETSSPLYRHPRRVSPFSPLPWRERGRG